jgi:hypothetical protein
MRRTILFMMLLGLALAACSTSSSAQAGLPGRGELQPLAELLIGTLKLEGTEQSVTQVQAAQLLPLWEVYQELITSERAAQAEIDGLTDQIGEAMTADQRQAIAEMNLAQQDMLSVMRDQGLGFGGRGAQGRAGTSGQGTDGGFFVGGMPGGGEMPPGGAALGGGSTMPGEGFGGGAAAIGGTQTPNDRAAQGQVGTDMKSVPQPLLEAVIQYLQDKAAG